MSEEGQAAAARSSASDRTKKLRELALVFLRLGTVAFGGPAAHIGMMEDEIVRRRRWLTEDEFLDLLGAANLIPGPNSTELAIHVGHRQAGWPGLLVAGSCFILPAALLVGMIAWAYVNFGRLPETEAILYGVKPVVIAVIIQALWRLVRSALKNRLLALTAAAAVAITLLGINELAVLFGTGIAVATFASAASGVRRWSRCVIAPFPILPFSAVTATASAALLPFGLWPMFLFFLKVGSVLFGSGYVLLVFLRADLVDRWQWLSEGQLLDAIAIGQTTPGPLFTTATFIGYLLAGSTGAVVATVGIFLPAFFFVAISGPLIPRMRSSPLAGRFLDGVNVASLALMAVVTVQIAGAAFVDIPTILLGIAAVVLVLLRLNSAWLVLGGALAGLLIQTAGLIG